MSRSRPERVAHLISVRSATSYSKELPDVRIGFVDISRWKVTRIMAFAPRSTCHYGPPDKQKAGLDGRPGA